MQKNELNNHIIKCNYCHQEQIVVHCGTNGNHSFEMSEIRRKTIKDCIKAIEQMPNRVEPISEHYREALKKIIKFYENEEEGGFAVVVAREALEKA